MIIKLHKDIKDEELKKIKEYFTSKNLAVKDISSNNTKVIAIYGDTSSVSVNDIYAYPGIALVSQIQTPYKKVSLAAKKQTIIDINGIKIGGDNFIVIAGPCSVESREQIVDIAKKCKEAGAHFLRGGVFKPRTSPYAFQGLQLDGLDLLIEAKKVTGLPIITEIDSIEMLERFEKDVDIIQVGARNMQNFHLLKALGKTKKPILLKRGLSATIEEWLMAAEYILVGGNPNVILCERGIRTFEKYTRNTLDLSSVLAIKELSHLPVIVDPSHASGRYEMVPALSKASLAVGADGLMIEVHNDPLNALSDGAQSLKPDKFKALMDDLKVLAPILGKKL